MKGMWEMLAESQDVASSVRPIAGIVLAATVLLALVVWSLKFRRRTGEVRVKPVFVYLAVVGGFSCACAVSGYTNHPFTGPAAAFASLIFWPATSLHSILTYFLGARFVIWLVVSLGSLVYFGIGFSPLLGALNPNRKRTKRFYIVVQVLLVILHYLMFVVYVNIAALIAFASGDFPTD
ncbi:MAG: hypothetical protein ACYSWQ_17350 [Planctomycetota bacterium]|jgi:hypothetical protein